MDDVRFLERVGRRAATRAPGAGVEAVAGDACEDVLAQVPREGTALLEESG